jgi:toxin ParE1/3/4
VKKTFDVVITNEAEKDFQAIWDYISQDSATAAIHFLDQIEEKIYSLENNPERCPRIPENNYFKDNCYRHLIHKDYRIVFAIREQTVFIHRIFHGAKLLDIAELENI